MNRRHLIAAAASVLAFALSVPVQAQEWPQKPIKLIVPFPAGGGTDIIGRVVGNKLAEQLKQPVIVENKPGAGGNVGVDIAAKSAPDGYTIVLGQTSNLAINPTLYKALPYDPVKDFAPVALLADAPLVLVVAQESKFRSLGEIIAAGRVKPEALSFGSPGSGTVAHLSGELLQAAAGVKFTHIPYKGSSQALQDLMGGRIDVFMSSVPTALAQIKGGKLRAIAVSSTTRSPALPDVPTMTEAGVKGVELTTWFGMLAPARTDPKIVERLNRELNLALQSPEVREKLAAEGGGPLGGTAERFAALLKAELPMWAKVVKDSGATVD